MANKVQASRILRQQCLIHRPPRDAKLLHAIELYNTYVADRERVFADRERANAAALETARKKIGEMRQGN